jgi:hypothetical protein
MIVIPVAAADGGKRLPSPDVACPVPVVFSERDFGFWIGHGGICDDDLRCSKKNR